MEKELEKTNAEHKVIDALEAMLPRDQEEDLHNLLAALVEQARAMANRMAGDAERETPCHFCNSPVPLWESLIVMQLAGVPAHVRCPENILQAKLDESGPDKAFPYTEFSAAVDQRLKGDIIDSRSGIIG